MKDEQIEIEINSNKSLKKMIKVYKKKLQELSNEIEKYKLNLDNNSLSLYDDVLTNSFIELTEFKIIELKKFFLTSIDENLSKKHSNYIKENLI